MELLVELLLEFLLQIVGEGLIDAVLHGLSRFVRARKSLNTLVTFILYLVLGLMVGGLSILIFPKAFVRSSVLPGINLLITPVLAGLTMSGIGWLRGRQGKTVIRLETFSFGFIFAFAMALIRFLFTE